MFGGSCELKNEAQQKQKPIKQKQGTAFKLTERVVYRTRNFIIKEFITIGAKVVIKRLERVVKAKKNL